MVGGKDTIHCCELRFYLSEVDLLLWCVMCSSSAYPPKGRRWESLIVSQARNGCDERLPHDVDGHREPEVESGAAGILPTSHWHPPSQDPGGPP